MFTTGDELNSIVRDFAVLKRLVGFHRTNSGVILYTSPQEIASSDWRERTDLLFLLPEQKLFGEGKLVSQSDLSSLSPRQSGAIQVHCGGITKILTQKALLLTSFDTEDHQGLGFSPATWLRQLRKRLEQSGSIRCGVEGVNTVFGGSSVYNTLCYTSKALELFNQGVLWKQSPDDNGGFHPLDRSSMSATD